MLAKKVGELAERPSKFYCLKCNRQCFTSGKHQWDCPECGVIRTAREDRCSCEDIDKCEWPGFHKMGVMGERLNSAAKEKLLREIGKNHATALFQDMQNSAYRGPKFTWENFPEMAARLASTSAFMNFSHEEKLTTEDENLVGQTAREVAAKLVAEMINRIEP